MALKLRVTDHPPYSLNLTPRNFHLFETLKKNQGHKKFPTDTDIKLLVTSWRQTLDTDLFYTRIHALVPRLSQCFYINSHRSDVWHLLPMCHVHNDVEALHFVMMCLHHCFLNTSDSSHYHSGCVMAVRSFLDKIINMHVLMSTYKSLSPTPTYTKCMFSALSKAFSTTGCAARKKLKYK